MSNVFGFPTAPSSGGDFIPIIKYDAPLGRMFRMDRIENNGKFASEAVDITQSFKAMPTSNTWKPAGCFSLQILRRISSWCR